MLDHPVGTRIAWDPRPPAAWAVRLRYDERAMPSMRSPGWFALAAILSSSACEKGSDATPTPEPVVAPSAQHKTDESKRAVPKPARHEDEAFVVSLEAGDGYQVGEKATVEAVLEARSPYKCNDEYPFKFKLDPPPEGVSFESDVARDIDKAEKRSVLSIPFTPASAGKKTISGTFYFSVCNKEHCKIDKRPMSLTVDVPAS
jgi:hypothetical protein